MMSIGVSVHKPKLEGISTLPSGCLVVELDDHHHARVSLFFERDDLLAFSTDLASRIANL